PGLRKKRFGRQSVSKPDSDYCLRTSNVVVMPARSNRKSKCPGRRSRRRRPLLTACRPGKCVDVDTRLAEVESKVVFRYDPRVQEDGFHLVVLTRNLR